MTRLRSLAGAVITVFLALSSSAQDQTESQVKEQTGVKAKEQAKEKDKQEAREDALAQLNCQPAQGPKPQKDRISRSWIPILGYNPTYHFFGGGGFFFQIRDEFEFDLHGISTQDGVLQFQLNVGKQLSPGWWMKLAEEIDHGFEPNFGAGNDTTVENRVDVHMVKNVVNVQFDYTVNNFLKLGPYFDYRLYRRKELLPAEAAREVDRYDPSENTLSVGIHEEFDFRDNPDSTTRGWYQGFRAGIVPSEFSHGAPTFGKLEYEFRAFQPLLPQSFDKENQLVVAYSLSGGVNIGTPTYLHQFRLGGTDRLRGFYDNRFRGKRYFLQQSELRFPIFKVIGGATFLEFGEATTGAFGRPALSYGLGVRIGLPPDYMAKIRIDMAFSKDQEGVFLDFGQAF